MGMTDYVSIKHFREVCAQRDEYRGRDAMLTKEIIKLRAQLEEADKAMASASRLMLKAHDDHCACEQQYADLIGIISSARNRSLTEVGMDQPWHVFLPMTHDEYCRFNDLLRESTLSGTANVELTCEHGDDE